LIPLPFLANRKIAVMGLGVAGLMSARALLESGADVVAWDDTASMRDKAEAEGIPVQDITNQDWSNTDYLVLSPGIPHSFPAPHPVAAAANAADVDIICDVELLGRSQTAATYVGITGTNGKSTTTALVGHILDHAGRRKEIGGNLGPPVLGLEPLSSDGVYVLELSSYQLERIHSVTFDIAALLNISEDHLDRHGGMDGYIAAKVRLFTGQADGHTAVIGIDDPHCRDIANHLAQDSSATVARISSQKPEEGEVGIIDGALVDLRDVENPVTVLSLDRAQALPGRHNWQNVAAAYAICGALGLDSETIAQGICSFGGLPHRQETVARVGDIIFVNDSKATNQDAAVRALETYDRIYWIAGGRGKEGGYNALTPNLPRIAKAFLIGEAGPDISEFLNQSNTDVAHSVSGTLDRAVEEAWAAASADTSPGEKVILLSPACASFDQFPNFGARGDAFRNLAQTITENAGRAA
jgi:UDP-N-acetylmuramoylalanine--D-glutamate ligase